MLGPGWRRSNARHSPLISWLLDPANAPFLALISFVIGALGTAATLCGLYLTFLQAKKAVSAADQATDAVKKFKFQVNRHDASRDISQATYALDATGRHLDNGAWRDVVDSYEDARRAIIRLDLAKLDLSDPQREALKRMAAQMSQFCNKVDAARSGKGAYPDPSKAKIVIRRNYELLASVQRALQEGVQP